MYSLFCIAKARCTLCALYAYITIIKYFKSTVGFVVARPLITPFIYHRPKVHCDRRYIFQSIKITVAREIDEDNHSDAGKTVDILEIINANDRLLDMIACK